MAVVVVATAADAHPDATTVDKQQKPTDNRPWAFFIPQGFPMRTLVLFLLLATSASAQDMPLRDFIPDGDGWKLVPNAGAMPAKVAFEKLGDKTPNAAVKSHDGTTLFVGLADQKFVWAYRMNLENKPESGAAYCALRVPKSTGSTSVTSLAIDASHRVYAATPLGVQVFDPTGRLCGVLHSPAPGTLENLSWEGEKLTVWIGEKKYIRTVRK